MAAHTHGEFAEKLSPYLVGKLNEARASADARTVSVLETQYLRDQREVLVSETEVSRHYEADLEGIAGAERIYRSTILIEPTTACAAHCRWCLRAQYEPLQLSDAQLEAFARYCGEGERADELREVLVTGGDPLLVPRKLDHLFAQLRRHAPNIHTYRVGTRLPLHAPGRIDAEVLDLLRRFNDSIEIGLHVNHSVELFPEVIDSIERIRACGVRIYNHTVLLRGVNDKIRDLAGLCDQLRGLSIENHYLFHCVPMSGMSHHRTSVDRGIRLARTLSNSGEVSGRSRPVFALLTAVGKVIPYEGTIVAREGLRLLLQTEFRADDRLRFNPSWKLPPSAIVGDDGRLLVWYEDALDEVP